MMQATTARISQPARTLLADHVVIWTAVEAGDVIIAVVCDDQDIVFAISACSRLAIWNCQHRLL